MSSIAGGLEHDVGRISMHILGINTTFKPCTKEFEINSYPITLMPEIKLTILTLQEVIDTRKSIK
jgi:hypothetical protein